AAGHGRYQDMYRATSPIRSIGNATEGRRDISAPFFSRWRRLSDQGTMSDLGYGPALRTVDLCTQSARCVSHARKDGYTGESWHQEPNGGWPWEHDSRGRTGRRQLTEAIDHGIRQEASRDRRCHAAPQ